jgi:hypothetical protein
MNLMDPQLAAPRDVPPLEPCNIAPVVTHGSRCRCCNEFTHHFAIQIFNRPGFAPAFCAALDIQHKAGSLPAASQVMMELDDATKERDKYIDKWKTCSRDLNEIEDSLRKLEGADIRIDDNFFSFLMDPGIGTDKLCFHYPNKMDKPQPDVAPTSDTPDALIIRAPVPLASRIGDRPTDHFSRDESETMDVQDVPSRRVGWPLSYNRDSYPFLHHLVATFPNLLDSDTGKGDKMRTLSLVLRQGFTFEAHSLRHEIKAVEDSDRDPLMKLILGSFNNASGQNRTDASKVYKYWHRDRIPHLIGYIPFISEPFSGRDLPGIEPSRALIFIFMIVSNGIHNHSNILIESSRWATLRSHISVLTAPYPSAWIEYRASEGLPVSLIHNTEFPCWHPSSPFLSEPRFRNLYEDPLVFQTLLFTLNITPDLFTDHLLPLALATPVDRPFPTQHRSLLKSVTSDLIQSDITPSH